jgi:hypothetical protein
VSARKFSGGAALTTLNGNITSGATTIVLTDASTWPATGAFSFVLDRGNAGEEKILAASRSGNTITVTTRGYDGSSALAHTSGVAAEHIPTAIDFQEANDHVNATTGVHGVSGALVGTTDTQSLSNKTLTSPTISGGTQSGPTVTSPTLAGTPVIPNNYIPQAAVSSLVANLATLTTAAADKPSKTTGAQTIANAWTFSTRPVLPDPLLGATTTSNSTATVTDTTPVTAISQAVTIPSAPLPVRVKITATVFISTAAGVGAVVALGGMSSTTTRVVNAGSRTGDVTVIAYDVAPSAGSKTYTLSISSTVPGVTTYYSPSIEALILA